MTLQEANKMTQHIMIEDIRTNHTSTMDGDLIGPFPTVEEATAEMVRLWGRLTRFDRSGRTMRVCVWESEEQMESGDIQQVIDLEDVLQARVAANGTPRMTGLEIAEAVREHASINPQWILADCAVGRLLDGFAVLMEDDAGDIVCQEVTPEPEDMDECIEQLNAGDSPLQWWDDVSPDNGYVILGREEVA